ncbi:hypothetical protein GCM10025883_05400 [Mobilicoccus caccae]|uniref:Uncharacterized protein n=2 Tax=Mobilicoccus caccae TaxID=1859295 RepID=A0ABQ6IKT5_9MICO|nr:hypothetical protein GCM10025883_05400 [Mobilicoccus caccae]
MPLFVGAAVAGLLHAAASLYWALGGTWLLDTVGQFAVDMQREGGPLITLMLWVVTLAKVAGALVPLLDHARPRPTGGCGSCPGWGCSSCSRGEGRA